MVRRSVAGIVPLVLTFGLVTPVARAAAPPDLFLADQSGTANSASSGLPVKRARVARINDAAMATICEQLGSGTQGTVRVNLFADTAVTAVGDLANDIGKGGLDWIAQVARQPGSSVSLVFEDGCDRAAGDTVLSGTVRLDDGRFFVISPTAPGQVLIEEPIRRRRTESDVPPNPPRPPGRRKASAKGSNVVDVLALYTPAAVGDYGGEQGVRTHLELEVSDMNHALAASGVGTRMRIVHLARTQYTGRNVSPALDALYDPADGVMDEAHTLRDRYGADLVVLELGKRVVGDAVGLAYMPVPPKADTDYLGFSTIGGIPGDLTLAHELGHNLGLDHDWITEKGKPYNRTYAYNHGYLGRKRNWHTIMAYEQCAAAYPTCPQVPYFSNPRKKYKGEPLGIASGSKPSDNVRMLTQFASVVAGYRKTVIPEELYRLSLASTRGGTATAAYPGPYFGGARVSLTARPFKGYAFTGWQLDGKPYSKSTRTSLRVTRNARLVAMYKPRDADLAATIARSGSRARRTYTIRVTNRGPAGASRVTISGRASGPLRKPSVRGSGCRRAGSGFQCRAARLNARRTLVVRYALKAGRGKLTVRATSATSDSNRRNNTVTLKR